MKFIEKYRKICLKNNSLLCVGLDSDISKIPSFLKEKILGKFTRTNEYIYYSGKLTIYDKKTKPVKLQIKSEYNNYVLEDFMEEQKIFLGDSLTEVYSKLSKWFYNYEIVFQNTRKSKITDETYE